MAEGDEERKKQRQQEEEEVVEKEMKEEMETEKKVEEEEEEEEEKEERKKAEKNSEGGEETFSFSFEQLNKLFLHWERKRKDLFVTAAAAAEPASGSAVDREGEDSGSEQKRKTGNVKEESAIGRGKTQRVQGEELGMGLMLSSQAE